MKKQEKSDKELIELGKKLQNFYDSGYVNKKQAFAWALLKGIASGFGAVIGGTIVVALLIWILSGLHNVPFLDRITDNVRTTLQQHDSKK